MTDHHYVVRWQSNTEQRRKSARFEVYEHAVSWYEEKQGQKVSLHMEIEVTTEVLLVKEDRAADLMMKERDR